MILSCIAAVADNGVIGSRGRLPWHLPSDLAHFRRTTMGHPVLMGRRTWESVGRPLPGRRCIVLTRRPRYAVPDGVVVAHSLEEGLERCGPAGEAFVAGGAVVFAAALPRADRLYLTRVHARVAGDVLFPPFDPDDWKLVQREACPADERNPIAHTFELWERARRAEPGGRAGEGAGRA